MAALSTPMRVFVAAGRFTDPDPDPAPDLPELAARIRGLLAAVAADESWESYLLGYTPPSVPEICAALEPVETHDATPFLARLAAVDLVWPSHRHLPVEAAEHAEARLSQAGEPRRRVVSGRRCGEPRRP